MKKVKKVTRKKGIAALKKIVAKAKQIYKAHPTTKWTNCIKQAAKLV
jgi:hypothetical protein